MILFEIKARHASARALAVEPREEAFESAISYLVLAYLEAEAITYLRDRLMGHVDDEIEIIETRQRTWPGYICARIV